MYIGHRWPTYLNIALLESVSMSMHKVVVMG